uniref:protein-serine/threonine phosphatase n=1 Tax=Anthurium amnicola TaxID=1678845 RepID=A0A1D1YN08_9ARAE
MCLDDAVDKTEKGMEESLSGSSVVAVRSGAHPESICENTVALDIKPEDLDDNFFPMIRCGAWSHEGSRKSMEDTHVCIADLAMEFGCTSLYESTVSFYGVFDGHGGTAAAHFVRDNLPRVIVEDADFPLKLEKVVTVEDADFPSKLEKVVTRSFMKTDEEFKQSCLSTESSGTTALTAMIFGRYLLVANAGDCRAVLSRIGKAIEMSEDHKPICKREEERIKSLGGYVDKEGYLNGELSVSRALGDWHLDGLKKVGGGPLSAEPELKMVTLTKGDEFLIIGSDGLWDVFSSEDAVDFAREQLQKHNDAEACCRELVKRAKERGSIDDLTALVVCFQSEPPSQIVVHRSRVRLRISSAGLQHLNCLLESQERQQKEND